MREENSIGLDELVALSREFGGANWVLGGGGNTSWKTKDTLWVKASGTTLAAAAPSSFVPLSRAAVEALFDSSTPPDADAREALVKEHMAGAVLPGYGGRPSVEAPLHHSIEAPFVVHTHPAGVNGLTCSRDGEEVCRRLFPDALWAPYTDPGYTLCRRLRDLIDAWRSDHGAPPHTLFLQNHGLFVAGATPTEVRERHARIDEALRKAYAAKSVSLALPDAPAPSAADQECVREAFREAAGCASPFVCAAGPCAVARGPLTPDHIVYAGSHALHAPRPLPTADDFRSFRAMNGLWPRVVSSERGVFGVDASPAASRLALTLALNGALVVRLSAAFGGVRFMSEEARGFIEHWEVESYRQSVSQASG